MEQVLDISQDRFKFYKTRSGGFTDVGKICGRLGQVWEKILQFQESVSASPKRVVEVHRCWTYIRQIRVTSGTGLIYIKGSVYRSGKQVL